MLQLLRFLATVLAGGGRGGQLVRVGATAGAGGIAGTELAQRFFGPGGASGGARRRRRRRVFNQMDRSDIAFIVATLGASAGTKVAMIIAARN